MSVQPGVGYTFKDSSQGTTLTIERPWAPWANYNIQPDEEVCPFTIVDASVGETYKFSCAPGMVNSVIPQIGIAADPTKRLDQLPIPTTTFNFDPTTGYSYIYLKVSADFSSAPTIFPVTDQADILYPRIISNSVEQFATDDSVFFLLATAYQDPAATPPKPITIWQVTCGSQWCDRVKLGTDTARYYFARV
jgi:hypothetical protein